MSAERQLRFISGKYQGGKYLLSDGGEVTMGRGMDAGLTLFEEMVSRYHAKFSVESGAVFVEDLSSKNGTFVNGERVEKRELVVGDRILMGTSILRLEEVEVVGDASNDDVVLGPAPSPEDEAKAALETMVPQSSPFDDLEFDESDLGTSTALVELSIDSSDDNLGYDDELTAVVRGEDSVAPEDNVEDYEGGAEPAVDLAVAEDLESVEGASEMPAVAAEPEDLDDVASDDVEAVAADEYDSEQVDPFDLDDDDLEEPSLSEVTMPGETASVLNSEMDAEVYAARWGQAPMSMRLARPMQPSLEFLNADQLAALQAAHNHGNMNGIAEALRKDDATLKKAITFLLRSGYLAGE